MSDPITGAAAARTEAEGLADTIQYLRAISAADLDEYRTEGWQVTASANAIRELLDAYDAVRSAQAERVAALEQERANLAVDLFEIVGLLQRCLQPSGSPPPGDARILAEWIIRSAVERIDSAESDLLAARAAAERSEGMIDALRGALRAALAGQSVPEDDYLLNPGSRYGNEGAPAGSRAATEPGEPA